MTTYKNITIDGTIFTSAADIDRFLENKAVYTYKTAVMLFAETRSIAASMACDNAAQALIKQHGYTWEQVEAIELETFKAA